MFFIFVFFLFIASCGEYQEQDFESAVWSIDSIDVYVDPSVKIIGDQHVVVPMIESAFYDWIDAAGLDIDINFIFKPCAGKDAINCISAETNCSRGDDIAGSARSMHTNGGTEIHSSSIVIYTGAGNFKFEDGHTGLDFYHVILHEIGHFFGVGHSEFPDSIMFESVSNWSNSVSRLTTSDVDDICAVYNSKNCASLSDYPTNAPLE